MPVAAELLYVDDAHTLERMCRALGAAEWLALDTEFVRERTYYPRLCLIQLATPDLIALVDPLGLDDLTPVLDIVFDPRVLKVVHAGRQDLEIFFNLRGQVPSPEFDTQIAAALLGHGDQIGYGRLVRELLDIDLPKAHTRTNWADRPLSPAQVEYAADDVRYLVELYPRLRGELERCGRRGWLDADFAELADPSLYDVVSGAAWRRVKGVERLSDIELSAVQLLAAWREETAQREDRPRQWVVRDGVLLALARARPDSKAAMRGVDGLPDRLVKRYGEEVLTLVQRARSRVPDPLPAGSRPRRLSAEQKQLVEELAAGVNRVAAAEGLEPSLLASRRDLERIAGGDRNVRALQGWRRELIETPLLAVLGRGATTVADPGS